MGFRANRDLFVFLIFFGFVGSKEMVWRFDSDITNMENWVGGKVAEGCNGVHFAPVNTAPVILQELRTGEVTLPNDGEVYIADGGFIEFEDNRKCINLKPIDYHEWYDPDSWIQPDTNVAIPDKQKIPCLVDDVVFPKIEHTRISDFSHPIEVRSIRADKEQVDTLHFHDILPFYTNTLNDMSFNSWITTGACNDPNNGCFCHSFSIPCPLKENREKPKCKEPITPEEFCHDICGAYLTFKTGQGQDLKELKKKLKEYSSDTHVSRVRDYLGKDVIQVVFSEKEFTGKSTEEAESFRQYLESSQIGNLQMFKSGEFYAEGGTTSSTLSIVFGSLITVVIFFGILLYLHSDPTTLTIFMNRFNSARGSVFNVPFFARFDNTDENLIIDSQSETGSILDIPKSFDNPMYGETTSQSSATTGHENPLYEVAKEVEE